MLKFCGRHAGGGLNRASFNAIVSDRDQVEYYFPAWRAAVEGGRVGSVMCSYNAVNGVSGCPIYIYNIIVLWGSRLTVAPVLGPVLRKRRVPERCPPGVVGVRWAGCV